MPRVTRGFKARRRRNKVLKLAKGYRGGKSRLYRTATEAVDRALCYAYRDRRTNKRNFRRLWITRINAAAQMNNTSYSKLIHALNKADIELDRKVLSNLAIVDPNAFTEVVKAAGLETAACN
ncbi:50S ribosomal protein L20 [Candidatus Electrothrix sp.]|uniref:50S ribosomal protein L20 n=1 Tax=Candidatus Electrothrix sp. TaxID=2170559 RepID=UPI0040562B7A